MDVTSGQHCDGPRTDTTTGRGRNGQSSDQVTGVGRTSDSHPPHAGQVRWMTPVRGQWIDESQPGAGRPALTLPASPRPATTRLTVDRGLAVTSTIRAAPDSSTWVNRSATGTTEQARGCKPSLC